MMRPRTLVLAASLWFMAMGQALADGPEMTDVVGSVPRNLSAGSFDLKFVVKNILQSDTALKSGETSLTSRISVYLLKIDDNTAIPRDQASATSDIEYYMIQTAEPTLQPNATAGNVDVTFYIRIVAEDKAEGLKKLIAREGANHVSLRMDYNGGEASKNDENNLFEVLRDVGVANAKPEGFSVESANKDFKLKMTLPESISFRGASAGAPNGVMYFVVRNDQSDIALPAKVYAADPDNEVDTTCTFSPVSGETSESCVTCGADEGNAYLDLSRMGEVAGKVSYASATSGSTATVSGLELGVNYAIFAVYQPDGLVRSACRVSTPTRNFSIAEYYGEDDAVESDPRCFIATAAYGSAMHPHLKTLRWFRDHFLKKTAITRALVEQYYEYSPRWAAAIKDRPALASATRAVLWPFVMSLGAMKWAGANPAWAFGIVMLVFGLWMMRRRRQPLF